MWIFTGDNCARRATMDVKKNAFLESYGIKMLTRSLLCGKMGGGEVVHFICSSETHSLALRTF